MPPKRRDKIKPAVKLAVYRRDNYECQECGDEFDNTRTEESAGRYAPERDDPSSWWGGKYLELDHVIPHSRGGSSEPDNLVSLCSPCNKKKLARTYAMFWPERVAEAVEYMQTREPSQHVAERAAEILLGEFHKARGPRSR